MPETPEKAAVAATASPKSSPTKKEIDAATMALNHFAQGKRHLVVGDIPSAVNSLQEACKLLAEQYGETAPECGDSYFCYGKALLEMARLESGVIGNALEGVPEGEDADNSQISNPEKLTDSEKFEVTELVEKALEENFESLEPKQSLKEKKVKEVLVNSHSEHTNGELPNGVESKKGKEIVNLEKEASQLKNGEAKHEEESASCTENESKQKEGSTENEEDDSEADADSQEGDSQDGESQDGEAQDGEAQEGENQEDESGENKEEVEGEKTEEDEEEVSNLQLSWEMLELSKVIFQKQQDTNPKMKVKVAEVYLKLGEVGLESENYQQAIDDFKQCLEIQKSALKSDDRCIAETYYQLGIAYSFGDEFDLAIESFTAAVNVLETRIANLENLKKEKATWTEEQKVEDAKIRVDPFYTEQGEIDEINQLLPEIKEKIVDMEQMKKDSYERIKAAKEAISNEFGAPSASSSSTEAKPIMVVRKKQRKLEEEVGEGSKKVKGENGESQGVNGSKNSESLVETKEKSADDLKKMEPQSAS